MTYTDPIIAHLDVIAGILEGCGYAIEVDYNGATILVWADTWPIQIRVMKRNRGDQADEEI